MVDIITFILSFLFLALGASRGFMKSLLVPLSIILATVISVIYYQMTHQMIISLVIGLIGPFVLDFLLRALLSLWSNATNTNIRPNFLSRMAGAAVSFAWGWVFIIFTLLLLAALPPWGKTLTAVHDDVEKSASYFFAKPLGEMLFKPKQNTSSVPSTVSAADANTLVQDPRFQKVLQDPEVQKEIDTHDIVKLMSDPKIVALTQQIMSDPETLKKVLLLYSQSQPPAATTSPVTSPLNK